MPDKAKLKRLADYYLSKAKPERAADALFAAEEWEAAMSAFADAGDVERQRRRHLEAHRCYVKGARSAGRARKLDWRQELDRQASACEEFLARTRLSQVVEPISPAIEVAGARNAESRIRAAEIQADATIRGHRMLTEGFERAFLRGSERLFGGLQGLSGALAGMGQDISRALLRSFEQLSLAHREAVLAHGERMLEGFKTLSEATLRGSILEAVAQLKGAETISAAERQLAADVSRAVCRAGADVRDGLATNGTMLLQGMGGLSHALETSAKLESATALQVSEVQSQALQSIAFELGRAGEMLDQGVRKHSRVLRQAFMGGLFADVRGPFDFTGMLKGVGHGITGRIFRDGTLQATRQLAENVGRLALPPAWP